MSDITHQHQTQRRNTDATRSIPERTQQTQPIESENPCIRLSALTNAPYSSHDDHDSAVAFGQYDWSPEASLEPSGGLATPIVLSDEEQRAWEQMFEGDDWPDLQPHHQISLTTFVNGSGLIIGAGLIIGTTVFQTLWSTIFRQSFK